MQIAMREEQILFAVSCQLNFDRHCVNPESPYWLFLSQKPQIWIFWKFGLQILFCIFWLFWFLFTALFVHCNCL